MVEHGPAGLLTGVARLDISVNNAERMDLRQGRGELGADFLGGLSARHFAGSFETPTRRPTNPRGNSPWLGRAAPWTGTRILTSRQKVHVCEPVSQRTSRSMRASALARAPRNDALSMTLIAYLTLSRAPLSFPFRLRPQPQRRRGPQSSWARNQKD